ncbi:MAG: UDP-glucose/GDP-mannose dehydrogenase family protein [Actinomycetota bacterium]|nr:UDP-glucose/GDP-mannose dehydrogenase family protein [Actinomycetota bacterium]
MRIAVVGAGYVGTVTATCLAWLGHDVAVLEEDAGRARQLGSGQLHLYEPGLPELLAETLATGRLRFSSDPKEALLGAVLAFICVGTPPGADGLPNLEQVERAVVTLARHMDDGTVIVNKSTLPIGSANRVRALIEERMLDDLPSFSVMSNPEFLREGQAVGDFLRPDRVVLGGELPAVDRALEVYRPILDQSFPGGRPERRPALFLTDLASAEMVKYAANAFLAVKISFANEIANLSEMLGADVRSVLPAIGADRRIGAEFLGSGLGWGGSCLPKDVTALVAMGRAHGYASPLLEAARQVNEDRRSLVVRKLQRELKVLTRRRIGILGLTFKAGTDDLRASPAVDLAARLSEAGAVVAAYDPMVKDAPPALPVRLATDPYEAAERADAVVVATGWPEFAHLDLTALAGRMRGRLVLDTRNVLPPDRFEGTGLRLSGLGWDEP